MTSPFAPAQLHDLAQRFGTPLWVYDQRTIEARMAELAAFDTVRFAQKACSNLHILGLMRERGVVVDAVSAGEIERALAAGFVGDSVANTAQNAPNCSQIVFTADVFDDAALALVTQHRIAVNVGSIDMIGQLGAAARHADHPTWLRINPGFGHGHSNKTNTGGELSKHGIWHTQLHQALAAMRTHGLRLAGLHMHIGSGVDYRHLEQVCAAMVEQVRQLHEMDKHFSSQLHAISAGGGLSTPYRAGDAVVDTAHYFALWDAARRACEAIVGHKLRLELEPGRFLVAESGVLLARVRAIKEAGTQHFTLVDAGFTELVRPAMYGSYHHMHIQRQDVSGTVQVLDPQRPTIVAGPLCESGDVFTQVEGGDVQPRMLGAAQVGDLLVIHDTGAYGASMSSNYNSRGLAAEVLVRTDGTPQLIRRRQTLADLLALEQNL